MVKKLDSLDELKKTKYILIDEEAIVVKNRIQELLDEKGIIASDLAKLTGIPRQNINAVIHYKMNPGIDFALKISYVLGVPVEEIFSLTDEAWISPFGKDQGSTIYLDMVNLEILTPTEKRERIRENGYEYFHVDTKELLTKEEYEEKLKEFIDENYEDRYEDVKRELKQITWSNHSHKKVYANQIRSQTIDELRKEFGKTYQKIYRKLGEQIKPYVLRKKRE